MIFCVFKDSNELLFYFFVVHSEVPLGHVGPCIIWQMEGILHNLRQYEIQLEKYVDIMDLRVQA